MLGGRKRASFQGRLAALVLEGEEQLLHCLRRVVQACSMRFISCHRCFYTGASLSWRRGLRCGRAAGVCDGGPACSCPLGAICPSRIWRRRGPENLLPGVRIWVPKQRPEIGRKLGPITVSFGARFLLILTCSPIFAPRFRPQIWYQKTGHI